MLKRRLGSNPRFVLHEAAVSDAAGVVEMFHHQDFARSPVRWSKGVTIVPSKRDYVAGGDKLRAPAVAIDDVLAGFDRIKVLKLNIEGAEYAIYPGILRHIDRIDLVVMSTHPAIPGFEEAHRRMQAEIKARGVEHKISAWH
jgi:FkbM family methyltransferase